MPSSPTGPYSSTSGTASAALKMSSKPMMASTRTGGLRTRFSVALSTVTQVASVPTSARATLKPFSGRS